MDKFEQLHEEKQRIILNAAFKTFSKYGYKRASTNEIIQLAGISKGILFHYFSTKQNLYRYLYETGVNTIKTIIYDSIDITNPDYLERLYHIGHLKLQLSHTYPEIFDFITSAYFEKEPTIIEMISWMNTNFLKEGYEKLRKNVDFTMFRDTLDLTMCLNTIEVSLKDFSEKYVIEQESAKEEGNTSATYDSDKLSELLRVHIEFLKKCFYK